MALDLKLLSRKEKVIIIAALAAIVLGLVLIYLQAANIRSLNAELEDEEFLLNQSRAHLQRLQEYEANAPFYRDRIAAVNLLLPDQPQEEQILRYFARLAEDYDLTLSEIRFAARTSSEEGFIIMPLNIIVEGRYRQLVSFLNALRYGERAVRVDTISIAVTVPGEAKLRININANAFHKTGE